MITMTQILIRIFEFLVLRTEKTTSVQISSEKVPRIKANRFYVSWNAVAWLYRSEVTLSQFGICTRRPTWWRYAVGHPSQMRCRIHVGNITAHHVYRSLSLISRHKGTINVVFNCAVIFHTERSCLE